MYFEYLNILIKFRPPSSLASTRLALLLSTGIGGNCDTGHISVNAGSVGYSFLIMLADETGTAGCISVGLGLVRPASRILNRSRVQLAAEARHTCLGAERSSSVWK